MNFRIKCLVQTIFGLMPNSEQINYLAQKYISKKIPPSYRTWRNKYSQALEHHNVFSAYKPSADSVVYEIGCGWHLAMAMAFSTFGYRSIKALDVTPHVRAELINVILQYLKADNMVPNHVKELDSKNIKQDLWNNFRIDLLVPADSTNTGITEKSIDFIYSQEVFGHIPPHLLPAIMQECHRILKDDGIISFSINYRDLYSGVDKTITPYNFLRYSEKEWKKYNPDLHYVNRLRHTDFIQLFRQSGFDVVQEKIIQPDNWKEMLQSVPISKEFSSKYTPEELSIVSANIVLRKTGCATVSLNDTP